MSRNPQVAVPPMTDTKPTRVEIDSVATYVEAMSRLMGLDTELPRTIWFRGHADASWKLLPGILRDPFVNRVKGLVIDPTDPAHVKLGIETAERMLNDEFRTEGASLLPPRAELVDIYFTAQHYGLPTRLLDWTQNPLAALFFAVNELQGVEGEVIAGHPSPKMAGAEAYVLRRLELEFLPASERHPLILATIQCLFDEREAPDPAFIIPLRPDARSGRMLQQGSCFTLHMPGTAEVPNAAVRRYAVPASRKAILLGELRAIGVHWGTLFPDLDHLCKEIKDRRKLI